MFWPLNGNTDSESSIHENGKQQPEPRGSIQSALSNFMYTPCVRSVQAFISRDNILSSSSESDELWFLGVEYSLSLTGGTIDDFMKDFLSRIWFTYRKDMDPFLDSNLTSDVGWGCMLRSGQMLLAQAIVLQRLGRSWRWNPEKQEKPYLEIIENFRDSPSNEAPFSIHNLIKAGSSHGMTPGQWIGPSSLCHALKSLSSDWPPSTGLSMAIFVAYGQEDGGGAPILCLDSLVKLCLGVSEGDSLPSENSGESKEGDQSGGDRWHPVLILIPLMLGSDRVNPRYLPSLKSVFKFPQSLGILGGKPGGAMYLVGLQGENLIFLDPHQVQPTVKVDSNSDFSDTSSFHCREPRKIPLESIDPSMALAFYCSSQDELEDFCERAQKMAEASEGAPLFTMGTLQNNKLTQLKFESSSLEVQKQAKTDSEDDWQIV